jgi:alpha-beta hydrolase superfamily lysophospholipase
MPFLMKNTDEFVFKTAGSLIGLVFCAVSAAMAQASTAPLPVQSTALKDKIGEKPHAPARGGKKISRGNPPSSSWLPQDDGPPVRAALLCIHGLGLHNETYEPFGKRMAQLGVATYALDMRGFGSYRQAKGHEEVDFDGCLDDLYRSLKSIRRAQPGVPVFLLGESMGGAIALHAMALRPDLIDGLITSVPAGDRYKQGRTSLRVAFNFIKDRNKAINVGQGVVNQATEKPELRAAWLNDPLARMDLSPMELLQFQQFMNQNHDYCKAIKDKPVMVVFGCLDKLVKPEGSEELFKELSTTDKEIYPVSSAEHLIFEENQFSPEVIDRVNNWINTRINVYTAARDANAKVVAGSKLDSL